jgi:hypothetical protein
MDEINYPEYHYGNVVYYIYKSIHLWYKVDGLIDGKFSETVYMPR